MKLNVPNALTILRVLLVPVFYACFSASPVAATVIFIAASLTDFLDGYLARKNNQITNFGKFMDPLADKLLVTTALVLLTARGSVPAWAAAVVVGRDLAVDGLRMLAASRGIVMAAGWTGKIKTAVTMVLLPIMFLLPDSEIFLAVASYIVVALNIVSLVDYFHKNGGVLKEEQ